MASLIERLRARPENKPIYTEEDRLDEDQFLPEKDQTTEQRGPVSSPLTEMERILDCDLRPTLSDNPVSEQVFVKQYYVKWKGLSYLHCSWVPVQAFEEAYVSNPRLKLKSRVDKFESEKESVSNKEDFVAIRPEWTTVDRILSSRGEGDLKEYLVKFKGLPYDECYWEYESYISTFQKEIQRFKDIISGSRRDKYVGLDNKQKDFKMFEQTPEFLTGMLHPFQFEGLNFLRFSWSNKTHVILADEMGLGKTIQSIAFLASLFEENQAPYLVVAPLSTLPNWEREFVTWAPHMNVVMYSGSAEARTVIREHEFYFPKGHKTINSRKGGESKQDRIKFDVLLTSYEMINIDTTFLKPIKWKCMIVDEGHRLKNMVSKLFASLKQYSSKHRVLLTGTPLQNNLDELFVLMHFLDAGKFGSLEEFQKEFKDISNEEQISRLHKLLGPHMLRRLKEDVLKDMPPKKELIVRVDLSSQQKEYYKAILTRNFQILGEKGGVKVSNVLMELRKVCLHPYMVEGVEPDIQDPNEAFEQLLESSGKMQLLDKMMVKLKEQGHRVLIYTQFQHMLDLLEDYCAYKNWFYERIDGKVEGAERQVRIDRFNAKNSNRFCFLLSTRAGGIGINLATADTVILYDSDWNPHADFQAMARAHRLGQRNKVMIYRLINRGTVEEKMLEMTKKKLVLEHLVVGKLNEEKINQEELDDIIRYGSKELFAQENEEGGKSGKIYYDDAAIEKLLDRDHVDAEEVSLDAVEENGFLKAFKVANFEYTDEEEAQAIENMSSTSNADRASYWEELLKDRYEAHQAEELNALGKRKRSCKQMLLAEDDDEVSGSEENSDEDCEIQQNDDDGDEEDAEQDDIGNQMARKPIKRRRARDNSERRPLMEGEGKSLKVLGFSQTERTLFMKMLMRYGVGNYDWKEFENPFQKKTYAEIKEYGILILRHITEDTQDDSPTFSDGVPKEGLKRDDVLERLAIIMLINEKIKDMEDHPTKPVFPNRILDRFPALKTGRCWKEEHDKILIRALYKHGYRKWQEVVSDKELGIQEVICKEVRFPYINLNAAEEAAWEESSLKRKNNKAANNNASADGVNISSLHHYKDMLKRLVEFVKKRGHLLEKEINYEYAEEYYGTNGSVRMHTEQVEGETKVTDTVGAGVVEADNKVLDPVPLRETITPEEVSAAAVDNKQERVEVAKLYNKMCKNLNENSGKSVRTYINCQPANQKLKNIFRPLESINENMSKSVSVTGSDHDVEMKDSVHESTLGSSKFMDLTMEEEETTKEIVVEMGGVDVIILDD